MLVRREEIIEESGPREDGETEMRRRLRTYMGFSIAWFIAWAIVLALVVAIDPENTQRVALLVFAGWLVGWFAATVGRYLYPPPKKRGPSA